MTKSDLTSQLKDTFIFTRIFQTFKIAVQPTKLLLAFFAVAVLWLAGILLDLNKTVVCNIDGKDEISVYLERPHQLQTFISAYDIMGSKKGFFETTWGFLLNVYNDTIKSLLSLNFDDTVYNIIITVKAAAWALKYHFIYSMLYLFIFICVMAFAGGGISRLAAFQFARGEKPGMLEAIRYSYKKYTSFFTGPLAPFLIIIIIGMFTIFLPGMLVNIKYFGEIFLVILMPISILVSVLMTIMVIGTIGSINLIYPSIAYDGADSLDAIGRTFSYVLAKPWRAFSYTLTAVFYGTICYLFVRFFVFLLLLLPNMFLKFSVWQDNTNKTNKLLAIWPKPEFTDLFGFSKPLPANLTESISAFMSHLFVLGLAGLVAAFIISFYFTANTIIYALLRKRVDNNVFEDIYLLGEE